MRYSLEGLKKKIHEKMELAHRKAEHYSDPVARAYWLGKRNAYQVVLNLMEIDL